LAPSSQLLVFCFREESHEPPFIDAIRQLVTDHGGLFVETRKLGSDQHQELWRNPPDILFAVSWRFMIPLSVFEVPRLGSYVFHDSMLPAYRGFSPTVWAMLNGEKSTGVTLFKMAEEVDSGDIIAQEPVKIGPDETIADVMEHVTKTYLEILERNFEALIQGRAIIRQQKHSEATFTCRRLPQDNRINWAGSAREIFNLIRAVTRPYSGAYCFWNGSKLTIYGAKRLMDFQKYVGRIPGRVVEIRKGEGVVVLAGEGAILLTEVQLESEPSQRADAILKSISITLA
jgi:methionyl-tRNA formyltransferase